MKYLEMVKNDVNEWICNATQVLPVDRDELEEFLNDELWACDEVTGNGSGSYTFNSAKAKEYVEADAETVREALKEFCVEPERIAEAFLDGDYEYLDVTARCYVLGQAIADVLDDLDDFINGGGF